MNTLSGTRGRNAGAIVAVLFGIALVGLFALFLASQDGATDTGASVEPSFTEPALPQGARYPQPNDKFAPGRFAPTATPTPATAQAAKCQGDGLVDVANHTALDGGAGAITSACGPGAYPAGGVDKSRPLSPMGEGRIDWSLRR